MKHFRSFLVKGIFFNMTNVFLYLVWVLVFELNIASAYPRSIQYCPIYLIKMVYFWTEILVYFSVEIFTFISPSVIK